MKTVDFDTVSPATRAARHQRHLAALGPLAGPAVSIDASYFADPNLADPQNDRTLLRARWSAGLEISGAWAEAGGLRGPVFKVWALAGGPADAPVGTYVLLHDETLARGALTHTYLIPPSDLPWEGGVYLRVSISVNNGPDEFSDPFLVRLDRIAPYEGSGIEHPPAPVPQSALVTDADLVNGFNLNVPGYSDHQPGDTLYVWLEREPPAGGVPPLLVPVTPAEAGGTALNVPQATLQAKGDGRFYLGYVLADKAGNYSAVSHAAPVTLVLGTLPGTLAAPQVPAADPVIDRADAATGVYVDVPEVPGWKAGDQVTVTFGTETLPPYTLNPGAFSALVDVPAAVLLSTFGAASSKVDVPVTYTIARLDWKSAVSPSTTVELDLSKAGPGNPDWPDPVNAALAPVTVTSASGASDEIPEADLGEDATLTFEVYDEAQAGETVEFFWGPDSLSVYTLTTADIPGTERDVNIPWAAIGRTLAYSDVPVYYRIRLASAPEENYQQSPSTTVDVSGLPLVAASADFPGADDSLVPDYLVLTCEHLVQNAKGELCIAVSIPDLSQPPYSQAAGDVVTLEWRGFSGETSAGGSLTPIDPDDGGALIEDHTLTDAEVAGFTWLVPYVPYGAATYKYNGSNVSEGMIQVSYRITVGSKEAVAKAPENVIAAFYDGSGPCASVLQGGCASCRSR